MKLEFLSFEFDKFAKEMQNLKEQKGFDYLVTIVGEDFSLTPDPSPKGEGSDNVKEGKEAAV